MSSEKQESSVSLREFYLRATEKGTSEERAAYLDEACGGSGPLREQVELLLQQDAEGSFLELSAVQDDRTTGCDSISEGPGTQVGRYKLLQRVGEGGMGIVYMADQTEPVNRKVALKIIKLGMDTKQVVARFEAERQALAMMDHPHIAKVLDAGSTETGRPYFVMELVRGVPITEYCDNNRLSTRERLELLLPVCHAIQHAHQKGVIHRDIKPSNVMVTLNDGVPHPMVIDFGVAKATHQRLTEKTLFTHYAQMIGTPAYMSPEQAEMSKMDVDTRSDVYSLGVLLYELLTSTTPFPAKELLSVGYGEMQRIISEQDPPKPSTRLSTMQHEERTAVAKNRSIAVGTMGGLFEGELDWIVMKALEKDRARRYETVSGLSEDIRRHLDHEPVSAAAPTFGYQLRKFAQRNRKYARAAALVVFVMVIATMFATWQAVRATRSQALAEAAHERAMRQQEIASEERAEAERARESALRERVRASANATEARANELRAKRLLYASDMRDVSRALSRNDRGRALQLLEAYIPAADEPEFRDWEWRYLWSETRADYSQRLADFSSSTHSLAVSRDGHFLAIGRSSFVATNALSVIDLTTNLLVPETPLVEHGRVRVAFSPKTGVLAFNRRKHADASGDEVLLWDPASRQISATFPLSGSCEGLHFSSDGEALLIAHLNGRDGSQILKWRVSEKALEPIVPLPQFVSHLGISEPFAVDSEGRLGAYTTRAADGGMRVTLTDLIAGKTLWSTQSLQGDGFEAIALSPSGDLLVTSADHEKKSPVLRDAKSGELLAELPGHTSHVRDFQFWPDRDQLMTAGNDQTIRVWDLSNQRKPRLLRTLQGHRQPVWQVAFSADKRTIYSGDQRGRVFSWDSNASQERKTQITLDEDVSAGGWFFEAGEHSIVALNRQGQVLRYRGINFENREVLFEVGAGLGWASHFSQNRKFLGVTHADGSVSLWDVAKQEKRFEKDFASEGLRVFSVKNDGALVLGRLSSAELEVPMAEWDLSVSSRRWSNTYKMGTIPFSAESADGQWWLIPHEQAGKRALLVHQNGNNEKLPVPELGICDWVGFSPDSAYFATSGIFGNASIHETATRRRLLPISNNMPKIYRGGAFSPNNLRFAASSRDTNELQLWDLETGQPVLAIPQSESAFHAVGYSPGGNLIGAQSDGRFHIWRAPTWSQVKAGGEREDLPPQPILY